jgi:hypothetical protein
MNTKITIKIHGCQHSTEVSEDANLVDIIEAYEQLLRVAGYVFDGNLRCVCLDTSDLVLRDPPGRVCTHNDTTLAPKT